MNYEFPEIRTIGDVKPHIEGRDEFKITETEHYDVVNYRMQTTETFHMDGPDDRGGAVRRECRGLIFDKQGAIRSRPLSKFFNIGERAETAVSAIDMTRDHVVMEKLDGSMIRPAIVLDGFVRLGTKMGITDVSNKVEKWLIEQEDRRIRLDWLREMYESGKTPIFEYIGADNRIVVEYRHSDLILLAVRDNISGKEYDIREIDAPFTKVQFYSKVAGNLDEYINAKKGDEGREGDIIMFADGHRVKNKNDWYVRIHKVLEMVSNERRIVRLVLDGGLDDALPALPADDAANIGGWAQHVADAMHAKKMWTIRLYDIANNRQLYHNRKQVATQFFTNNLDIADFQEWADLTPLEEWFLRAGYEFGEDERAYIFKLFDLAAKQGVAEDQLEAELPDLIRRNVANSLGNRKKWERTSELLGLRPLVREVGSIDE